MKNYNFKIGDKVKSKDNVHFTCRGKVLTIVDLDCPSNKYLHVTWKEIRGNFPLLPSEIEHTIKVGKQLMFSFMERK